MEIKSIEEALRVHCMLAGKQESREKAKNDERVIHDAVDGYYWGKKYAWRVFGMMLNKQQFSQFLAEINHPYVACLVKDTRPGQNRMNESIAYLEDGLRETMENLVKSSQRITFSKYTSPMYSKQFVLIKPHELPLDYFDDLKEGRCKKMC